VLMYLPMAVGVGVESMEKLIEMFLEEGVEV
jgi:hypothetical protein